MIRGAPGQILLAIAVGVHAAAAPTPGAQPLLVERHGYLMGTRVALSVWAADRARGQARLERAYQALEETDADLSTWRDESPVSQFNRTEVGEDWRIPPRLCPLFGSLAEWHALTGGAFDPAIGALTRAWDIHGKGRVPHPQDLNLAHAASGFDRLHFVRHACSIMRRGADVTIDVGAFGKGEALDRAGGVLDGQPWMIDLGGQISVGGWLAGQPAWPMALSDPRDRSRPRLELSLPRGSLSTSGGSERDRIVDGVRVGHILDPRTGRPATFDGSATVWHDRALIADILSTALYVMGPKSGLRWADEHRIAVCFLQVNASGVIEVTMSSAFRPLLGAVTGAADSGEKSGVKERDRQDSNLRPQA